MLKTICGRGGVLQLSPNWGGVKSSGGITEMDRHKMPYHAAINAHVLHYVVSNHAFTDTEKEKHYCSPYHENKNAMAPSSTAEQVPE